MTGALPGDTPLQLGSALPSHPQLPPRSKDVPATRPREPATTDSEIAGVVLDAIGGPIAGARISARRSAEIEPGIASLSAGAGDFRLRLPVGSWQVSVEAEGYAPALFELYAPTADVRLPLSPESVIAGRVVSGADRRAVAGVTVTARKSDRAPYSLLSAVSDAAGAFELRQLPAGMHQLEALSGGFRGEPLGVELGAADTVSGIELEVTSATTITGEIRVGETGCADGTLELSGPVSPIAVADEEGRLQIQGVLPGSYELIVTCLSALPVRERLVVGNEPIVRSWALDAGVVVRGSVETASGRPLADAVVRWTRREEATLDGQGSAGSARETACMSDVHGEFACSGLEPGHYTGHLHVQGRVQSASPELHVQGSGELERVRLRADASAAIRVSVEGQARAPGAAITVFACRERGEPVLAQRDGEGFLLEGLPLGTYRVHLGGPECTGGSEAPLTLQRDGEVAEMTLPLPRLARAHGRLVDRDGAPVADAWVRASDAHPAWALLKESAPAVMTNAEGEFSVSGLLPGRYEVLAHASLDTGAARQSIELGAGDELELELVLERGAAPENLSPPSGRHLMDNTK